MHAANNPARPDGQYVHEVPDPPNRGGPPVTQHGFQTTSLPACTTSRETGVRGLAQDIARAEPKLAQKTVAILLPETRGLSNEAEALEQSGATDAQTAAKFGRLLLSFRSILLAHWCACAVRNLLCGIV
jgi:hypothetical protein